MRPHRYAFLSVLLALAALLATDTWTAGVRAASAAAYPPAVAPFHGNPSRGHFISPLTPGLLFSNTHTYGIGLDPAAVVIKVEVYNNFFGDFSKYWWVYRVTNNSYEPAPAISNGFSGFELALPIFVADIGDVSAPDGIPPWLINCCSGQPVEWDLTNTGGAVVLGGTLPGQTEIYAFTTLPRLVTISTGWFHTWMGDSQNFIVNYPAGDGPEVPDLLSPPDQELCCSQGPAGYICQVLPAGQCDAIGGTVVVACSNCPPVVPTQKKSWGQIKTHYR